MDTPPLMLVTTPPADCPPADSSRSATAAEISATLVDIERTLAKLATVVIDMADDMRFVLDVLRAAGSIAKPIRKAIDEAEARRAAH